MPTLARNIAYNTVGQLAVVLLGFVAVRSIYAGLGPDALGIFFFAWTLGTAIAAITDLGISTTIIRAVAGARTAADVHPLLRTSALLLWSAYLLLAVVVALASDPILRWWIDPGSLEGSVASMSLAILAAASLLALPRGLYSSFFKGRQRMDVTNGIDAGAALVQQGGIVATIALGGDLMAVSWWVAISSAGGLAAYFVAFRAAVPAGALLPGLHRNVLRDEWQYAAQVAGVAILGVIHVQADKLIVSRFAPLAVFGLYAFGTSAINRGLLLAHAAAQAVLPALSLPQESEDHRETMLDRYRRVQDLLSYAAVMVFAVAPFATLPAFDLLFGSAEADRMLAPLTLFAVGSYMSATLYVPYTLALAMGRPAIGVALNSWALLLLPVTFLLALNWGVTGAALSWILYNAFAYSYMIPRIYRECVGESPATWYYGVAKFLAPALGIYAAAWLATGAIDGRSALVLAVAYLAATAAYALAGWLALASDTRLRVVSIWRSKLAGAP